MARELFLDQTKDFHDFVRAAVSELESGNIVAIPDECGWHLMCLATSESGSRELLKSAELTALRQAVSVPHPSTVIDYISGSTRLFQKLSSRCWPGPIIMRCKSTPEQSNRLVQRWPEPAQNWGVSSDGRAFYCPADSFSQEVLRQVSAPVLSLLGTSSEQLESPEIPQPVLFIRGSQSRFNTPHTVVSVIAENYSIERSGVVSERMLARQSGEVYLFVCTGNTCRSPMAEAIFRKMLSDRLNCREDELVDHGYAVVSAGLAAYKGSPAAPEAIKLLRDDGIDLTGHESQPITEELLFHCDHILAMTRSHRDAVLSAYPDLSNQVRLLSPESVDVPDPIGGGLDEYVRCRNTITRNLEHLLESINVESREGN
ncbi:Sua5/YciO/YrdC/YwlC family protein [Planctomicrobium sp. SH668]|uniref:arsenate reductase/protein-tyrosine-phosphatase family protein n=1 Tax=Planctomicrobium sp. SH668 TaxID=3448126 RepID=UPI003F5BB921